MYYISKINKILFWLFLLIIIITFFTRNNYRNVDIVSPEVIGEPKQSEVFDNSIIKFTKDDYEYELTPLYDYEINGMIVHKMDYTWFSIYKRDSVFPIDLCLIWGDNVANKVYKHKNLKFSQDFRFCLYHWRGNIDFNHNQLSNNHLVIDNKELEKKLNKLSTGDQIKITGKLVNIKAENIGEPGKYDPEYFNWKSSINRKDSGGGACETIYIEDIEIIEKSNIISHQLFTFSIYGLLVLIIINIIKFILEISVFYGKKSDN